MKATSCFGISLLIAFGAISFIPTARAQQTFQVIGCSSGKTVTLSEDKALTIYSIVGRGPAWSIAGNKSFDDMTWDFVATLRVMDSKTIGIGYYKFTDADGDYFILEASGDAVIEGGTWNFLSGTGKWKGATGKLRGRVALRGKPLAIETEQYWCRVIGTLELQE